MLSAEEKHEIEAELAHADGDAARVTIDALKVVQEHRGWVSDDALAELAEFLGLTTHELDSVATFYNHIYRKPVGRHVIRLCDSISCWVMGYETVCDYLKSKLGIGLGETTADDRFTLLAMPCLGACDLAPAMMVDKQLYGDLTPEKIDEILEKHA